MFWLALDQIVTQNAGTGRRQQERRSGISLLASQPASPAAQLSARGILANRRVFPINLTYED